MFNSLIQDKKLTLMLLVFISVFLYGIEYFLLGNVKDLMTGFLGNLAFLPVYIIIVTLMIEQVLRERERQSVMRKLNMVIGVFFSEVGNRLLKELTTYVVSCDQLKKHLIINNSWKSREFSDALAYLQENEIRIDSSCCDKAGLRTFLIEKRGFLIGLLENQNLLEHEQFTDLLWSVFHLVEELEARNSFDLMPESDVEHLNGDIKRVYGNLSYQWVMYMQHLKQDYPYLFSLAIRLNPLADNPSPTVY
jgi:hypothetical protein